MKAARALVAGLALAGSAVAVSAVSDPQANDVLALNYALQLEYLEANYYEQGLAAYSNAAFQTAGIPTAVRDYLILIKAHEDAHVTALSGAITGAYAQPTPSQACTYPAVTQEGVQEFLATALAAEDVGVSAYTAALNHLTNTGIQQVAATIATIEARHAAFLRNAVGSSTASPPTNVPFPDGTNPAVLPVDVVATITNAGLYNPSQCPYNLSANIPTLRPSGVATNTNLTAAFASSATPTTNPAPQYTQAQFDADLAVLNYALTLEHLEADFYNVTSSRFNADSYNTVSTVNGTGNAVVSNVALIAAHEAAHVKALQGLILARGGQPVTAGCYDWSSVTTPQAFLTVAALLENTGVSAYDGAANGITDTGLQQIAASVATVEARHAAYLNVLNGKNATNQEYMNGVVDQPLNKTQIVTAVSGLTTYVKALTGGCASVSSSSGGNGGNGTITSSSSSGAGSSSSSSGGNGGNSGNGASFAVPAIATAALAFVAALLF